ncbi:RNase P subunit p30 family protein [Halorarius litoreus]|uniref:RNase P subunit p30 family protein n=1 Tax=Halorarius litoreus TaxID=2962676 RepID=UPI0020CD91FE|nr:RNase P subunit p30 family protein [Halorarius litoreus]
MYEGVHAHPDGDATVSRLALTARECDFDGVVVRNHGDRQADYEADGIANEYGVDVVEGIELRTDDRSQASGLVTRYREERTLLLVHGGDTTINRFACEQPEVDVLAHPMRGDGDVNHVLAKAAAENGVRFEFDLGPVLRDDGGSRVRVIKGLRKLRELVETYDVPYVVSANPTSHLELRAPRELVAVGEVVGFDAEQIREGLREWGRLAARNRDRLSEEFLEPGVRLARDEEER